MFVGEQKICIKELGCFGTGPPFLHPLHRPISVLPKPPESFMLLFWMWTRRNPVTPQFLFADDPQSLKRSAFNPTLPTKVIIHGYQDNFRLTAWMSKLRDALLQEGDYNVIVVDWSIGALPPYSQAVANTRVVGAEIARLVFYLQLVTGATPASFHLVGHSLGAHVAGYAGKRTIKLGRITGLDPAGLYFQKLPPEVHLHWQDATFVDVIHSDAKDKLTLYPLQGFGTDEVLGHADMFPNNGSYNMTDCQESTRKALDEDGLPDGVTTLFGCDHLRSIHYFYHSILHRECLPVGVLCESWDLFLEGRCANCGPEDENCAVMGLRADVNRPVLVPLGPRRFYLLTSTRPPYCLHQYQLILYYAGRLPAWSSLFLSLDGNKGRLSSQLNLNGFGGASNTYLVTSLYSLGGITNATLWWGHTPRLLSKWLDQNLRVIALKVTPIILGNWNMSWTLCPADNHVLVPQHSVELTVEYCVNPPSPDKRQSY